MVGALDVGSTSYADAPNHTNGIGFSVVDRVHCTNVNVGKGARVHYVFTEDAYENRVETKVSVQDAPSFSKGDCEVAHQNAQTKIQVDLQNAVETDANEKLVDVANLEVFTKLDQDEADKLAL